MSLDDYLRDIARVPMLTCDEEIMLGNKVQDMIKVLRDNGLDEQILRDNIVGSIENLQPEARLTIKRGLKARDRIISANMRLVVAVVRRVKTAQIHMSTQDLMQEGAIGLARAAEKFEPGRGYKFSTYAYWWIRQGIVRAGEYQEKTIRVPANVQKAAKQIADTKARLSAELGKEPTILQIASEMKEKPERIKRILLLDVAAISLDCGAESGGDQASLLDAISFGQEKESEDQEESLVRIEFVTKIIDALPDEDRELIKQKYGIGVDPLTIKEIAIANEASQRSVKEKHERIVSKIRVVARMFAPEDLC
jgi:RNA polymerase sigma factor (sigma-70 family)